MTICLPPARPPSPSETIETLVDEILAHGETGLLAQDLARWQEDLQRRLQQLQQHPEQGLGFIEEHIRQASLELQRLLVQKTMQAKADTVAEKCPACGATLTHKKRRVPRWVEAYCGKVKLLRSHGWCPHCKCWHFPADRVLGLRADSTASPLVQEMCALLVSKMPAEQAEAICLRVTGRGLSRSTLAREAQRQGDRAIQVRRQLVAAPAPAASLTAGQDQPAAPFTLVIQIDAWNVRERDHWGQTQKRRRQNLAIERWHWVYTATCFRLTHRCKKGRFKNKLRPLITERSYVATRGGIEALREQLRSDNYWIRICRT